MIFSKYILKNLSCSSSLRPNMFAFISFLLLTIASISFANSKASNAVSVMFYNVQNLFDWKHEKGKNDWDFLPLNYPDKAKQCETIQNDFYRKRCLETDWNEEKFNIKLQQIKKVVANANGRLPDILGLSEVENDFVVQRLAKHLGYSNYIVTRSPDPRGIDVALLYNNSNPSLIYLRQHEHFLKLDDDLKPTRNILEVEFFFTPTKEKLIVYVVHWPSQYSPSRARMLAAQKVDDLTKRKTARDRRANVLVIGDFNVISSDHPHPFREVFDGHLYDARREFLSNESVIPEAKKNTSLGTYFYPPSMSWDNLDRIFYNSSLRNGYGLEANSASFRILSLPHVTKTFVYERVEDFLFGSQIKNVPNRYNFKAEHPRDAGFSDHFAVTIDLFVPTSGKQGQAPLK